MVPDMSAVDHPEHYQQVPGIECVDVAEHFGFLRGNAIKYLWRAGSKGDVVEDLRKAAWYIEREIARVVAEEVVAEEVVAEEAKPNPNPLFDDHGY